MDPVLSSDLKLNLLAYYFEFTFGVCDAIDIILKNQKEIPFRVVDAKMMMFPRSY